MAKEKHKPELVIFVGAPASGKSTYYAKNFADTHIRVNLDTLKRRSKEAKLCKFCLDNKLSLVIDNTNPTIKDRKKYIDMFIKEGYHIKCIHLRTCYETLIIRNNERQRHVPRRAIKAILKDTEYPTVAERIDEILIIME